MKIYKTTDTIVITSVITMIYGEHGAGKTSIASTSKNSFLFDFDGGSHRSKQRGNVGIAESYDDFLEFFSSDEMKQYDNIIIDTAGRLQELVIAYVAKKDPRLLSGGVLNQRGYGVLKGVMGGFSSLAKQLGKNIHYIAHEKVEKHEEEIFKSPDIAGATKSELSRVCDAIFYLYDDGKNTILSGNASRRRFNYDAKLPCEIPDIIVPDLNIESNFYEGILTQLREGINENQNRNAALKSEVEQFAESIAGADSPDALNIIISDAAEISAGAKKFILEKCKRKGAEFGSTWDKVQKAFV